MKKLGTVLIALMMVLSTTTGCDFSQSSVSQPEDCAHANASFHEKTGTECGNMEGKYYYCGDCKKYFEAISIGGGRYNLGEEKNLEDLLTVTSHSYDSGKLTKMPDGDEDGEIVYSCKTCSNTCIDYFNVSGIKAQYSWFQNIYAGDFILKRDIDGIISHIGGVKVFYDYAYTASPDIAPYGTFDLSTISSQEISASEYSFQGEVSSEVGKYPIQITLNSNSEFTTDVNIMVLNRDIVKLSVDETEKLYYDIFAGDVFSLYDGSYGKTYGVVVDGYTTTLREDCFDLKQSKGNEVKFKPITSPVGEGLRIITEDGYIVEYSNITVVSRILTTPDQLQGVEEAGEPITGLYRYCNNVTETKVVDDWGFEGYVTNYHGYFILGNNIDCKKYTYHAPCTRRAGCGSVSGAFIKGQATGFTGTFDGRGYCIKNASFHMGGLLGEVGEATIKNIGVVAAEFYPDQYPGYVSIWGLHNYKTHYENCYFEVNFAVTQNHQSAVLARNAYGLTAKNLVLKVKMTDDDNDEMGALVSWPHSEMKFEDVLVVFNRTDRNTPLTQNLNEHEGVTTAILEDVEKNSGINGLDYSIYTETGWFVVHNYIPVFKTLIFEN